MSNKQSILEIGLGLKQVPSNCRAVCKKCGGDCYLSALPLGDGDELQRCKMRLCNQCWKMAKADYVRDIENRSPSNQPPEPKLDTRRLLCQPSGSNSIHPRHKITLDGKCERCGWTLERTA